jgi:hypothetical protein
MSKVRIKLNLAKGTLTPAIADWLKECEVILNSHLDNPVPGIIKSVPPDEAIASTELIIIATLSSKEAIT